MNEKRTLTKGKFIFFLLLVAAIGFLWLKFEKDIRSLFARSKKTVKESPRRAEKKKISCYITGEVRREGIYHFPEGSSVKDLVQAAGGLTDKADDASVNLSMPLTDCQTINVPKKSFFRRLGFGRAPEKTYFIPPMEVTEEK